MRDFLWVAGHLGWGIFALIVFSGLWLLVTDLCWRLLVMKIGRLLALTGIGWLIGIVIILLVFNFAEH